MPRRRILTPARQQAVELALRNGATKRLAAQYAGMGETLFYTEMRRNPAFEAAVKEAEAHHEMQMVSRIKASATAGDWKAAAWWLERQRYDEWGSPVDRGKVPAVSVEVRGGAGAAIAAGGDASTLDAQTRLTQLASAFDLVVRVGGFPVASGGGELAPPVGAPVPAQVDEVDTA